MARRANSSHDSAQGRREIALVIFLFGLHRRYNRVLRYNGSETDDTMTVAFYHGTTRANAEQILRTGFRDVRSNFMTDTELVGVWLSNRQIGKAGDGSCEAYLRVEFEGDESAIEQFEVIEDGKTYREWLVPAQFIASHATVKLADTPAG